MSLCVDVRLVGFRELKDHVYTLCIDDNAKVSDILERLSSMGIKLDYDEIMIVCNDKQIYIDDSMPNDCKTLMIFPLALGG